MGAPTIAAGLKQVLAGYTPFSQMDAADLDFLVGHAEVAYFGPDEVLLSPSADVPSHLFIVKQGRVRGENPRDDNAVAFEGSVGDCFPVGALLAARPVSLVYRSSGDTFALVLARAHFEELTRRSQVFLDFCKRRLGSLLDLSRQQMQAAYAADANAQRTLATPLGDLLRGEPLVCRPETPLREVFARMHERRVGSIIVTEPEGEGEKVAGILTRTDLIGRVILPAVPLDAPVSRVMSRGVMALDAADTAADATMLMAEHSIRHVPVMSGDAGQRYVAGVVSERDLFAMQRLTVRQLAVTVRRAADEGAIAAVAADIRRLSYHLVAQGVAAPQLTRLISHLNDQLTVRLLQLACEKFGIDPQTICWLAFGSEGRREQTIATDQDNGLIHAPEADLPRLLEMADWVNTSLAAAGFPLCKGKVMARNPELCLTAEQWHARFAGWIDRGDPQSLLNASIYFDLRPLFGDGSLADGLREEVVRRAQANLRFLKQMSDNALRNRPPDSGGIFESLFGEAKAETLDLKMHGTVLFVDAARIWSLAAGLPQTNTSERFRRLAEAGKLPESDAAAWIDSFEFFQLMRLRVQHRRAERGEPEADNPNLVDVAQLSPLDRRIVKEGLRQARKLQSRLQLDFPG
jgi:CBS domain-containing protein